MNADKYQRLAARTLIDKPDFDIRPEEEMLVWNALGLAGEAGEVADHIKKAVYHQQGIDREHLRKEIGDVCWYLAALCTKLDLCPVSGRCCRCARKTRAAWSCSTSCWRTCDRQDSYP